LGHLVCVRVLLSFVDQYQLYTVYCLVTEGELNFAIGQVYEWTDIIYT